jgi:hypothetical protein
MPLAGFRAAISAGERPQTCALDRVATGTGGWEVVGWINLAEDRDKQCDVVTTMENFGFCKMQGVGFYN